MIVGCASNENNTTINKYNGKSAMLVGRGYEVNSSIDSTNVLEATILVTLAMLVAGFTHLNYYKNSESDCYQPWTAVSCIVERQGLPLSGLAAFARSY